MSADRFVCRPQDENAGKRCAAHVGVEGPRKLDAAALSRFLYDWPPRGAYRPDDATCASCGQRKLAAKQTRRWCYGCGRWAN